MNVDTLVQKMSGETMAQGVTREPSASESGDLHALGDHMSDGTLMHGTIRNITFKEKFLGTVLEIILWVPLYLIDIFE